MSKTDKLLWGADFMIGGIGYFFGGPYAGLACFAIGAVLILFGLTENARPRWRRVMFEIVEKIHRALGIESTWAFVLVIALSFGCLATLGSGVVAWVVARAYKNSPEYKAAHPDPKSPTAATAASNSASQSATVQGSDSSAGMQNATTLPQVDAKPPKTATTAHGTKRKSDAVGAQSTVSSTADCSRGGLVNRDNVYRNGATPQLGDCSVFDNGLVQGNGRDSNPEIVGGKGSRITHNTQEGFNNPSIRGGDNAEISGNLQRKHQDTSSTQDGNGNGADMDEIRAAQTAIVYECHDRECCHGTPFPDAAIPGFDAAPTVVGTNKEKNSVVADGLAELLRKGRKAKDSETKKDWLIEVRTFLTANLGQKFTDAFDKAHNSFDVLVVFENELRAAACD